MNGIFDGLITEALSAQGVYIGGFDLNRCQGQLFDQAQCRPQFVIDWSCPPVIQNRLRNLIAQRL